MMKIKRILLIFFLFCAAVVAALPVDQDIRMQLPVRVFDGKETVADLGRENFILTVNNEKREIPGISTETVSMGQKPDFLRRHFILSFHGGEYGNELQKAVSYFVSEILGTTDSLTVVSPVKIYRIDVSGNKERMISDIDRLVKGDCAAFKAGLDAAAKSLDNEITRMKRLFAGGTDDNFMITSYKMVAMFLNTFPRNFLDFRNRYLFLHMNRYRQVMTFLGNREGQRWWVHFQQAEPFGMLSRTAEVIRKTEVYGSSQPLFRESFSTGLNQLKKLLQLSDSFPAGQLIETFLSGNTRFNVIVAGTGKGKAGSGTAGVSRELGTVFSRISRQTGGKTVHTVNPEQGMKEIEGHEDFFYRLSYRFDGHTENKTFAVTVNGAHRKKLKPAYKAGLNKDNVRELVQYLNGDKVTIGDVSLKKNLLTFYIGSFEIYKGGSFGLVKVRVEMLDRGGSTLYRTENTLRSSKPRVKVSLPLPGENKGAYKLVIHACDLIANRLEIYQMETDSL